MGLLVSTTGSNVPIPELGIVIPHPTTDFDLLAQFDDQLIEDAASLTSAILAGTLTWKRGVGAAIQAADSYDPYTALRDEIGFMDPARHILISEDWINGIPAGTNGFTATNIGGGSTSAVLAVDADHPGVLSVTAGNANNRAAIVAFPEKVILGSGELKFTWLVSFPALITSTGVAYRIGLGDATTAAEHVDGVYFNYHNTISANWVVKTSSNSTRTQTITGIAIAANTWYKLMAIINAAGTSVKFYVNGTLVATHTTNIPTGTARIVGPSIQAHSITSAVLNTVYADYFRMHQVLTNPR